MFTLPAPVDTFGTGAGAFTINFVTVGNPGNAADSPPNAFGGENLYRNKDALYFLPNENEWHKAAYFNGTSYFKHATGSDIPPAGSDEWDQPGDRDIRVAVARSVGHCRSGCI